MGQVTVRRNAGTELLVKLDDVKDALSITGSTQDAKLTRLIKAASARVEKYCGRVFGRELVTERIGVDIGGIGQDGDFRIMLSRRPILMVEAIRFDAVEVDITNLVIEDSEAGFLFTEDGFSSTELFVQGIERVAIGRKSPLLEIDYSAGYILPTFGAVSLELNNAAINADTEVITAEDHSLVVGDTVGVSSDYSSLPTPLKTWRDYFVKTTPTDDTFTLTDTLGGSAIDLSADGPTSFNIIRKTTTLPRDLEGAIIDLVVSSFRNEGRDRNITAEKLGDFSVSYATSNSIPDTVKSALSPFRNID